MTAKMVKSLALWGRATARRAQWSWRLSTSVPFKRIWQRPSHDWKLQKRSWLKGTAAAVKRQTELYCNCGFCAHTEVAVFCVHVRWLPSIAVCPWALRAESLCCSLCCLWRFNRPPALKCIKAQIIGHRRSPRPHTYQTRSNECLVKFYCVVRVRPRPLD